MRVLHLGLGLFALSSIVYACGGGGGATTSNGGGNDGTDGGGSMTDEDSGTDPGQVGGSGNKDGGGGGGGDGGSDGGTEASAPTCNLGVDPGSSAPCVTDQYALFVDGTNGVDSNAGTKAQPFKTIGAAIANGGKSRIYICDGTYDENVTLDATHAPSLYGGFDCATWHVAATNHVNVTPATGFALSALDVPTALTIADIKFIGGVADATHTSSIAAYVRSSPSITMERLTIIAQDGFSPAKRAAPSTNFATQVNADAATGMTAGVSTMCTCVDGTTTSGGRGGGFNAGLGQFQFSSNGLPANGAGAGGNNSTVCTLGAGTSGASGTAAALTTAVTKLGALDPTLGFVPADAVGKSANGHPGQGGGGGGDGAANNGYGGGGGCGGCGGAGGAGGAGGGASIALLTKDASVHLTGCTLTTGNAGAGGAGADAEGGQGGVGGASGSTNPVGCIGGDGSRGAGGNGGHGGAGGVSIGLLFSGTQPVIDGTAAATSDTAAGIAIGTAGAAGGGGAAGPGTFPAHPGVVGTAGPAGVAKAIQDFSTL